MASTTVANSVVRDRGHITVTVTIPVPAIGIPSISSKFPPSLPGLKLPDVPKAIQKLTGTIDKGLQYLIVALEKLVALIPDISITLIVKIGRITIINQKIGI
jgi:hypothetical protein